MSIKFVDLFAGIGGFHLAVTAVDKNAECILACELDAHSRETYLKNFPETPMTKDVRTIDPKILPDFDLLCAGFPCQPFSNGGKKQGFMDKKNGNLFFEIVRIVEEKKPKFLFLENVKGILSNDNGKTIKIINSYLNKLGYVTTRENLLINSKEIGVLQNRERVYFLCVRKDLIHKKFLPNPKLNYKKHHITRKPKYINNISDELNFIIDAWGDFVKNVKRLSNRTLPVIWIDEMINPIDENFDSFPKWKQKYILDMKEIYKLNKNFIDKWYIKYNVKNWSKRNKKLEWQAGKECYDVDKTMLQLRQSGLRFSSLDCFPALVAMVQIPINVKERRYYSLEEMSEIQTFPENFIFSSNERISLKQLGNSVTVDVLIQLIEFLLNFYNNE